MEEEFDYQGKRPEQVQSSEKIGSICAIAAFGTIVILIIKFLFE